MDEQSSTGPPRRPGRVRRLLRAVATPSYREALSIVAIAVTLVSLFAASYSLVLGRAAPHHIPAGLVGSAAQHSKLVAELERATGGTLALRPFDSAAAATAGMNQQRIYAALVVAPGAPELLVSSASGSSVSRVLAQAAQRVMPEIRVVDVHPLPSTDPLGLVSFYVTLAAGVVGFTSMFQLRLHAGGLSLRAWLGFIALLAVLGGFALASVAGPLMGALTGPFPQLWGVLTSEIVVVALVVSALQVWVGRWAIVPTWLLFVILGNTSSGGAVAPPLLPPFYAFVGRFLPPGATVNMLHGIVYFPQAQRLEPFLVQGVWLVCGLAALLVSARLSGRRPTGKPIGSAEND